ncbi:hypothetical protein FGG79_03710 [Bacillus sp. BHET2]|uniref:hypothetical protein n=1 Tax=Bacillus sp. BHET2 TaxID=2583818 RepID=UPI00110E0508|nr:hypothetical protein [Bacillus sp. BHET2]TMU87249.1 hypothetical protein FGG79_03710 [Bacillus sp. BHET2]
MNNLKLQVIGFRLINNLKIRGIEAMEKKKGVIPSIIFGFIILLSILVLTFFIFNGEFIHEVIKDGLTDE